MAQLNAVNFKAKFDALFADNTTGEISEADLRTFVLDLCDSFFNNVDSATKLKVTTWNGASFPTATEPTVYILTADHGSPEDADYIPAGAWAIALTAGVTTYSSLYIKP